MNNKDFMIEEWVKDILSIEKAAKVLYIKEQIVATLMSSKFDSIINDTQLDRNYNGSIEFKSKLNAIINDTSKELSTIFEIGLVDAMVEIITTKNYLFETMHLLDGKYDVTRLNGERVEKVIYPPITLSPENMQRVINAGKTLKKGEFTHFIECIRYHPTYKWYATTLWREALEKSEKEKIEPLAYHNGVNYSYYAERFLDIGDWKSYFYCTMQHIQQNLSFFWSRDIEVKKEMYDTIVNSLGLLTWNKEEIIINKFGQDKYNELKDSIRDKHTDEYYNIFDLYM